MMDITFKTAMDYYLKMVESACTELLIDLNREGKVQIWDVYDLLGYKQKKKLISGM